MSSVTSERSIPDLTEGDEAAGDAMRQCGRVKRLRGEEDLRHASQQDFSEEP
ncbi:hypothetical protein [Mesorhizobium sp. M1396]|uniref:hypothetical protein n=1 Tax=unclassified Mesorhizobium TaxID=325217 RepID=UPI00333DAFEC